MSEQKWTGFCDHSGEACECGMEIISTLRAAQPAATGEGADAYKGKVGGADGIVRPVMPWSERVREAEARPAAPPLCDPECVHCAAWRGRPAPSPASTLVAAFEKLEAETSTFEKWIAVEDAARRRGG